VLGLPILPVLADSVKGRWDARKALNAAFQQIDDLRTLYEREPFSSDPDWTTMIDQIDESLPPGSVSTV